MADFDPPFGESADKRMPTPDEQANGFACGPADRRLFDGMFNRIEAEIGNVISAAGLTQTNGDLTQLRQAINLLIAAATGGGSTADYVLMSQSRVRLPIYPEIKSADGRINISSPAAGTVRVPSGVVVQHRGIFQFTTVQTDFSTVASKTYHLRWDTTSGFSLKDLSNGTYNPSTLVETDVSFDSNYDDMLVARIVTNASNVATITNLVNLPFIRAEGNAVYSGSPLTRTPNGSVVAAIPIDTLNWSRRPNMHYFHPTVGATSTGASRGIDGHANFISDISMNRYGATVTASSDFESPSVAVSGFFAQMRWSVGA